MNKSGSNNVEKEASPKDPSTVLALTSVARTLTISDQHANILLNLSNSEKALLKLTLVPFHKEELACLPLENSEDDDATSKKRQAEEDHSARVLQFLNKFKWEMTSESGAEYSFHQAFIKGETNDVMTPEAKRSKLAEGAKEVANSSTFKVELIYPASERQVSRAMPSPGMSIIKETPELYFSVTKPFIDSIVASGSLSWVQNIVEVKKEKERLLLNAEDWILNIDTKWRSHPDALTVPRSEWYQHESVVDLYCLGILKTNGIATLRDLNGREHLQVLRDMVKQGPQVIEKLYGVPEDQLRIFVHYQPQFYHFHVHFTRLENEIGAQVEKAHLISDIIQDLENDPDCFQKKTITYKLSTREKLYQELQAHKEATSG